jgi:hypothetical protein
MGALILPHRLQQQPQQVMPIDWSHPLTRGLVGFWLPNGNGFRSSLPNIPAATIAAAGAVSAAPKGRRLGVSSTAMAATLPNDARIKPTAAITVLMDGGMTSVSGSVTYAFGCENSNDGWGVYNAGSGAAMRPYLRVGSAWADQPSTLNAGQTGQVGFTFDGSTFWAVTNGSRSASQAISGTITNSTIPVAIGAKNNGGTAAGNGSAYYFAIWNRALSPAELASFYANPWQIFKAPARRIWAAAAPVGPITGTFSASEAADILAAAGGASFAPITGAASSSERSDTLIAAGEATFSPVTGTAAASEGPDTAASVGTVLSAITGSMQASEAPDTLTAGTMRPTPEGSGGGGGAGSVREVRDFAAQLDRARKPTKGEKKRRKLAIESAVLELLPDEPAAERVAPVLAQIVARELPPATWAPVYGPRPATLPPAVVADVRARVAEWLAHQRLLAELEDEFETELLLLG